MTQELSCTLSSKAIRKRISDKVGQLRGTDIKAKSARAVVALSIGAVAGQGIRFVRNMILARILAPDQFGIMALVMSFSVALEALTEVGIRESIIQNKHGAHPDYLNVAWWMQVARGLCLFGISFLLAPWISSFYENPEMSRLLRVAFLAIALRGFVSPRAHVLEKEYKFGRAVFLLQGSAVLATIVTIVLAWVVRNVWALAIGFVAEMALLCVMSFVLVPFLPRFKIDRESLGTLIQFSRGMFGLPILNAISFNLPVLILGKVISSHELGMYSLAAMLAYIPTALYAKIVGPVLLPAFSEKQSDKHALCRGLLQMTRYTAILVTPLIAFMACCSRELLAVVYEPQYAAMAIPFIVLCLQRLARNEATVFAGIYLALGLPHQLRRFSAIRALSIVVFTYPAAVGFGAVGVVLVIALSNVAVLLLEVLQGRKVIDLDLGRYMRSYVAGIAMAMPIVVAVGLARFLGMESPVWILTVGSLVFIAASVVGVLLFDHKKT